MDQEKIVLVIEDEVALQDAMKIKLTKEGIKYLSALTAEDALEILKTVRPSLIYLDLLMPGMGGFAFLEKLRQTPLWRDIPVVIVSVSASPEKIRRAFELNVVDYLVKSQYKLEDIVGKIKLFLSNQEQKLI